MRPLLLGLFICLMGCHTPAQQTQQAEPSAALVFNPTHPVIHRVRQIHSSRDSLPAYPRVKQEIRAP